MSIHADRIIAVRTTKIVYLDGDTVVKVFDSDYSKADVLNEAINQARVEETGLPIPKLKAVQMMDGKWTISLAYVEGKKLQQLMVEEPERYDEYLEMFVDLQLTVHHKRVPLLTNMRDKMNRKIEISGLEEEKREALKKTLAALPMRDALCHGDFIPSNIMIDREGRPYILDWSHATQGEPCADAARTYLLFRSQGREDTAAKYLGLFCEKSKTAKEDVLVWAAPVAASHLVKKGRPMEREFMRGCV
ncbi:MAG: aminoglycoside phosphotransferase family protein [Candidatus Aphodomonas sp.]|nr:aminoglycoside phosphotransferase family protein [Candidatus Aphodomonas sp.]